MATLASIAGRLLILATGLLASRIAYTSIPDYPLIPVSEPKLSSTSILLASLAAFMIPRASWLLLFASGLSFAASASAGNPSYMLLIAGLMGASAGFILSGWRGSGKSYSIEPPKTIPRLAAIAFAASAFIIFSTTMFEVLVDALTSYFTGLPGDVGFFYGVVTETVAWRLIAYVVSGVFIFKVLEFMVDVTTKMGRGGEVLARYDALSGFRTGSRTYVLMKGDQYGMLSEGYSIIAAILYYPVFYTVITGFFTFMGMNLEDMPRTASILVPALTLPTWIIVRAFIKQAFEPEPVENLLKKPKPFKPVFYAVLALLIVLGLHYAGIPLGPVAWSALKGEPLYVDPFSTAVSDEDLAGALDALVAIIDEGGRILIQLLWGG